MTPKLQRIDETLKYPLHELITKTHKDSTYRQEHISLIKTGLSSRADVLVTWVSISNALSHLKTTSEIRYTSMLTLVATQLGYGVCTALDDVVKLATKINFENHFMEK